MLNGFGWPHLLIIAALLVILFGAKRLPDAARGLGRSMRIFRAETRGMAEDEHTTGTPAGGPAQAPQSALPPQQPYVAPVADQAKSGSPVQGEQQR